MEAGFCTAPEAILIVTQDFNQGKYQGRVPHRIPDAWSANKPADMMVQYRAPLGMVGRAGVPAEDHHQAGRQEAEADGRRYRTATTGTPGANGKGDYGADSVVNLG